MRRRVLCALIAVIAWTAGACSPSTDGPSAATATTVAGSPSAAPLTGAVTVFAAASLTAGFNDAKTTITAANPRLSLTFNFAGSNALVTQIIQGAPADVFASADMPNMQKLVDAGLVQTPVIFARNTLQIAVQAGNPKGITGVADLARSGISVVLAAQGVPAGDYTRQVLADQRVILSPKSLETDVKSALSKVTSGEADATVVYLTDIIAGGPMVTGVTVPDAIQPAITYPIAVVKGTKNAAAAQAFVDSAVSGTVQKALGAAGFLRSTP